jgi:hypothetical protein
VRIESRSVVPARREAVFEFLSDLENHWEVGDRFIEVLSLDRSRAGASEPAPARGGHVRVRGPLGLRRTAATRVIEAEPPGFIAGTAQLGERTRARVSWTLAEVSEATEVRLSATVEDAGPLDRLLLNLGGRVWLRRHFAAILARLAERFERSVDRADESEPDRRGPAGDREHERPRGGRQLSGGEKRDAEVGGIGEQAGL